jgi:hypothetical protein
MPSKLSLHPKVAAGLLAGWVVTLVVYSLHQWAHTELPAEVGAALTGLFTFGAGWLAPSPEPTVTAPPVAGATQ